VHRVRCLPQIAGNRLISKKGVVDKRLSVWWVAVLDLGRMTGRWSGDGLQVEELCLRVDDYLVAMTARAI
jgi:hypothetical protein